MLQIGEPWRTVTNSDETPSEPTPDGRRSLTASEIHSLTSAGHPAYWDYDPDALLDCPACGWSGPGRGHEELFHALFDVRCPECDCMLLVVQYPTNEETRRAAAAGNVRAIKELPAVEEREELQRLRDRLELTDPAALPDLVGDALVIEWDMDDGGWTVLRHGDTELWREPVYYEGEHRFEAVAKILQAKYGDRFVEFRPTPASELYLYGDHFTGGVSRVNSALRERRRL